MTYLVVGLCLFLGAHSVSIVAPGWRDRCVARIGAAAWRGLYSLVALAGLVLLIVGYGAARADPMVLYRPPFALRYVNLLLMLPVFPLLLATYLPGRISAGVKHPMLTATKSWATAHLLVNGTLADVVLFGAFLAWAVADRISLKRRAARPIRIAPPNRFNDSIAVIAGLALYVGFFHGLHRWLTGMPLLVPW